MVYEIVIYYSKNQSCHIIINQCCSKYGIPWRKTLLHKLTFFTQMNSSSSSFCIIWLDFVFLNSMSFALDSGSPPVSSVNISYSFWSGGVTSNQQLMSLLSYPASCHYRRKCRIHPAVFSRSLYSVIKVDFWTADSEYLRIDCFIHHY